jgi:toxin YoeB
LLKRLNLLIRDIERDPYSGIGKPEALKHDLQGFWSRRISDEHQVVYQVDGDTLYIAQC